MSSTKAEIERISATLQARMDELDTALARLHDNTYGVGRRGRIQREWDRAAAWGLKPEIEYLQTLQRVLRKQARLEHAA